MRILLTGKNGQLGQALYPHLCALGDVVPWGRSDVDLADEHALARALANVDVDLIVNAAAYTAVDRAEQEPRVAFAVNERAPQRFAAHAIRTNAALIHYSTDFVFDGLACRAYVETDRTSPQSVYGTTKRAGELAVLESGARAIILRTSWVYGIGVDNFVGRVLARARLGEQLTVVADQVGSPTSVEDLTAATLEVIDRLDSLQLPGLMHVANAGAVSRFEFARRIVDLGQRCGLNPAAAVVPARTQAKSGIAARPAFAPLDSSLLSNLLGRAMPAWEDALERTIRSLATPR